MARKKQATPKKTTPKKRRPATKEKNPVGRPPKFRSAAAMQKKIDAYFDKCEARTKKVKTKAGDLIELPHPIPLTVEGLCNALGFLSRTSIFEYQGKPEFVNTIKRALQKIQQSKVEGLLSGEYSTAGAIFDLKNNHGYVDRIESKQTIVLPEPPQTTEIYTTDE